MGDNIVDQAQNEARERVLATAERLFSERGYTAVTLRDIAAELGMKQASLYYHVPGGKEELFVVVMERNFARHRAGLEAALADAGPNLRAQLQAAARWLLSQPPVDLSRMIHSDMPAINPDQAARLMQATYTALMLPVQLSVMTAAPHEALVIPYPEMFASSFLVLINQLHDANQFTTVPKETLADAMIDMLLNGIRSRNLGETE